MPWRSAGRQRQRPEPVNVFQHSDRIVQVHWLLDERIRMLPVAGVHILRGSRARENDGGYRSQARIVLHTVQNFVPVHPWHIEIKENKVGPGSCLEWRSSIQKAKSLNPIPSVMAVMRELQLFEEHPNQAKLVYIVVDNQEDQCTPLRNRISIPAPQV